MFVKHLQEYLDQFTDGKKGNAVSNATIYMEVNGHLEEVKRIEVQESNIIGQSAIRVVLKPTKQKLIIAPNTPDYNTEVTLKTLWAQRLNYIKKLKEILHLFHGFDWKIIAYLALLIYWPIILLATFSQ